MDPSSLATTEFGRLAYEESKRFWWFDPAPMLRELDLEPETQLALSEADAALGKLAGVGGMLKNPLLLMRPSAVREALASAQIEGTQASLSDVYQAESGGRANPRDADITAITSHVQALERGLAMASRRFNFGTACDLHAALMAGETGRKSVGGLRVDPVWLGSPTAQPHTAVFVPPIGDAIGNALSDWEDFISNPPRLPALIRAALMHYQFLTIHPFMDGNGRVGRMLVLLFLRHEHRVTVPLLYVSPYFATHRREYYDRLQAVRERGEMQQWLQFFLTAISTQANDGVWRAQRLLNLREKYRSELSGSRSRAIEVVEMLFAYPIITTTLIRDKLDITSQGALNLIRGLEARGWLVELNPSGRGSTARWLATEVYDAIAQDEVGEDAGDPSATVLPRSERPAGG